ncbi:MAG TPA: multicopper oxidase domain-containing protein [Thermomicrobiaceae bacterium]|nr:multicopper oxidase domain-containing protein [Thermomicrobiaceae bacterium]
MISTTEQATKSRVPAWPAAATGALRAVFGVVWAISAYLTYRASFANHYVGYIQNASQNQPSWLNPWFNFWINVVSAQPDLFIWATRIIETLLAIGLIFGIARKLVYISGALFSLLIWSTAEGFSGPYTAGATNLGPALVYVLLFIAFMVIDRDEGRSPYSIDYYLEQRWPVWRRVSELAPAPKLQRAPVRLSWPAQILGAAGLVIALIFLFGTLTSAMNVSAPTPNNAAVAVSPLSLTTGEPVQNAFNPALPPLIGTGDSVDVNLTATDTTVEIASGVSYQAWTFNSSVPAPIIHVRQGQTVNVTMTNHGSMKHSIDFHAAQVPANVDYRDVDPGQSIQFSFKAEVPGVFMYHCGTPPVLLHIGNGMFGAIVVDPARGMPPADVSYVLVQNEWYTRQVQGSTMAGDYSKMLAATPDEVTFNAIANQYKDHPLTAKAGQRIRIYLVDAGPNLTTAFHVIGGMFAAVYPDGDPSHALTGVSTYQVVPGEGVVFDIIIPNPGQYTFVDHSMRNAALGAAGVLDVSP